MDQFECNFGLSCLWSRRMWCSLQVSMFRWFLISCCGWITRHQRFAIVGYAVRFMWTHDGTRQWIITQEPKKTRIDEAWWTSTVGYLLKSILLILWMFHAQWVVVIPMTHSEAVTCNSADAVVSSQHAAPNRGRSPAAGAAEIRGVRSLSEQWIIIIYINLLR